MSDDAKAKLLYMAIGTALDCGATPAEIKDLFRAKNINFVLEMLTEKEGTQQ